MKRICKTFAVLLVMAIALYSFSITAGATEVSNTQDGLVASITSKKDSYKSNEDIELTFKVTNTNDFAVENLSLEAIIPDGLTLKNNADTTASTVSLGSGESLELTLTAVKESSVITVPIGDSTETPTLTQPVATEATENTTVVQTDSIQATTKKVNSATSDTVSTNSSDNTTIQTGNTMSYLLVGLICLVCLAVAVIAFRFRKKAVKYLSLVLCVCIAVGSVAFVSVTNTMAQETTQQMSFEVSKTITVDNEEYEIKLNIKYDSTDNATDIYLYASQYKLLTAKDNYHQNTSVYFYAQYYGNVSKIELLNKNTGKVIATLFDDGNIDNGDIAENDNLFSGVVNFDVQNEDYFEICANNGVVESNTITIEIINNFTEEDYTKSQKINDAVLKLVSSNEYKVLTESEKANSLLNLLNSFVYDNSVIKESINYDELTKTIYYTDLLGAYYGISLESISNNVNGSSPISTTNTTDSVLSNSEILSTLKAENSVVGENSKIENGVIIYGLSYDPSSDNSYKNYERLVNNFTDQGLNFSLTIGTVDNLKTVMRNMDFVCIECHGMLEKINGVYTPVFSLTEEVNWRSYLADVNQKKIIRKLLTIEDEGTHFMYCITPDFIKGYYGDKQMNNTNVWLGCCDGFGVDGKVTDRLAQAFISCGASSVIGHVNSVLATYDNKLMTYFTFGITSRASVEIALYKAEQELGKTDREYWEKYENGSMREKGADSYNKLIVPGKELSYWEDYRTNYLNTSIKGRVSEYKGDGISGPSLGKVKVTIEKDGEIYRTATTDSTGNYTLNPVEPGTYIVKFTEKDHETVTKEVNISLGQSLTADISMKYKSTSTELSGVVYSDVDKLPLSGVEIKGYKSDSDEPISLGTTSTDGIYSITVDSDIEKIEFSLSGFKTKTIDDFLLFDGNVYLEKSDSENISFAGGDGTKNNPYQVSTPEQLNAIRYNLNANYVLINDIDMSNIIDWVPIGKVDGFSGVLDGRNFTISNLKITGTGGSYNTSSTISYNSSDKAFGLFCVINNTSTIKNLVMKNINVNISGCYADVGMIAGISKGNILNCSVNGNLKGVKGVDASWDYYRALTGGIVGRNEGNIKYCKATSSSANEWYGGSVGGITGCNTGTVDSCTTTNISLKGDSANDSVGLAGGIAGRNTGIIRLCQSDVTVFAYANRGGAAAGGIAGANSGTVTYSYFNGDVSANAVTSIYGSLVGGIVGSNGDKWYVGYKGKINNCVYTTCPIICSTTSKSAKGIVENNYTTVEDGKGIIDKINEALSNITN